MLAAGSEADPAEKLRSFWAPAGKPNPENEKKFVDWLARQGWGEVPLAKFLNDADFLNQRKYAATYLKL